MLTPSPVPLTDHVPCRFSQRALLEGTSSGPIPPPPTPGPLSLPLTSYSGKPSSWTNQATVSTSFCSPASRCHVGQVIVHGGDCSASLTPFLEHFNFQTITSSLLEEHPWQTILQTFITNEK